MHNQTLSQPEKSVNMLKRVNHCSLGQYHMLDKIAYDYAISIARPKPKTNIPKIKRELDERVKKLTDEEREKLRELIQKWQKISNNSRS